MSTEERKERPRVLFLCTGNSCRSQMAEGWARELLGDLMEVYSAGVAPSGLDPRAVKVMAEVGIDISGQSSKHVDELPQTQFDYVITLCDEARQSCPVFPAQVRVIHRSFQDPPLLALSARNEEEALGHYRAVRDQIRRFVQELPAVLSGSPWGEDQ